MSYTAVPDLAEMEEGHSWDCETAYLRLITAIVVSTVREAQRGDALGQEARSAIADGSLDVYISMLATTEQAYQRACRQLRELAGVAWSDD